MGEAGSVVGYRLLEPGSIPAQVWVVLHFAFGGRLAEKLLYLKLWHSIMGEGGADLAGNANSYKYQWQFCNI